MKSYNQVAKVIGLLASISTIVGTCIAVIALIPAFGQWLNPHNPAETPIVPTNTYFIPTLTSVVSTTTPNIMYAEPPQTPIFQPAIDNNSLIGVWDLNLNWNCDDTHYSGEISFSPNNEVTMNTGSTSTSTGAWTLIGNEVQFTINSIAPYVGTLSDNKITGTMVGADKCPGTWFAIKK